jgi:hypothetical protein
MVVYYKCGYFEKGRFVESLLSSSDISYSIDLIELEKRVEKLEKWCINEHYITNSVSVIF